MTAFHDRSKSFLMLVVEIVFVFGKPAQITVLKVVYKLNW